VSLVLEFLTTRCFCFSSTNQERLNYVRMRTLWWFACIQRLCACLRLCTAQLPRGWLQVDPPMTLQSNSKPAAGSHPCIQHLETPTWNCCRFRERRKRLGENINASREHMTMIPETVHHQLVKPQSKSKQPQNSHCTYPFHQDLKGGISTFLLQSSTMQAPKDRIHMEWT
jgi:hypothetical protein